MDHFLSTSQSLPFIAKPAKRATKPLIAAVLTLTTLLPILSAWSDETLEMHDGKTIAARRFDYEERAFDSENATIPRTNVAAWRLLSFKNGDLAPLDETEDGETIHSRLAAAYATAQNLASRHPGVSGIHVTDHGTFTLTSDGAHRYQYHFIGLILNDEALDWTRLSLQYRRGRSQARIVAARSFTPDDGVQTLSHADVQISSPSQDGQFFSTDLQTINAVVPGAEVGSLVEFIVEFNDPSPEAPELFSPSFFFQGDIPVVSSRLDVIVPEGTLLNHWADNWPESHDQTPAIASVEIDGKNYTRHRWLLENMPPILDEPLASPYSELVPAVHTTLLSDWTRLDELVGGMQRERIQVTPEIQALADELVAQADSTEDRVAAIYHWVQKNIRYISVKSSLSSGWSGHPAPQTLAQGYGDCTDKSILFCALLQAVGIEAVPVVVRTNDRGLFFPPLPVINCNHCITKIFLDEEPIYLDATSQDYRFPAFRADDHGVLALDFIRGVREPVPVPPAMRADAKHATEIVHVRQDGSARVTVENTYAGEYEARLRAGWKTVPVEMREHVMKQYLNSIAPGSRLISMQVSDPADLAVPFSLSYTFENDALASASGDFLVLQLPGRELQFPEVTLDLRRYPIAYETSELRTRRTTIVPEPGLNIVETPENLEISTQPPTSYTESFSTQDDGTLIFESTFLRTAQRVPTQAYPNYRDALRAMRQASLRVLLFKK